MKTYEQTVEEVFRRRAAYERERQRKKRVLRQSLGVLTVALCLLLAVTAGLVPLYKTGQAEDPAADAPPEQPHTPSLPDKDKSSGKNDPKWDSKDGEDEPSSDDENSEVLNAPPYYTLSYRFSSIRRLAVAYDALKRGEDSYSAYLKNEQCKDLPSDIEDAEKVFAAMGDLPFPLLEGEMQFSLLSYTDYGESGKDVPHRIGVTYQNPKTGDSIRFTSMENTPLDKALTERFSGKELLFAKRFGGYTVLFFRDGGEGMKNGEPSLTGVFEANGTTVYLRFVRGEGRTDDLPVSEQIAPLQSLRVTTLYTLLEEYAPQNPRY